MDRGMTTEQLEISKQVKLMAGLMGLNRSQILDELRKEYKEDDLNFAIGELDETLKLYGDGNKVDRRVIKRNRIKNNMSFSQVVRKRLK